MPQGICSQSESDNGQDGRRHRPEQGELLCNDLATDLKMRESQIAENPSATALFGTTGADTTERQLLRRPTVFRSRFRNSAASSIPSAST